MAKFLTTVGNSFYIEQIILNSAKALTLVTPYLKLNRNLIERLRDAQKEGTKITLIYGKNQLAPKEKKLIFSFKNVEIYFCENLHAKCYHNETSMIITSMNLYEFSERNNREMGLLIEKEKDREIFDETLKEIESIKNASKMEKSFKEENLSSDKKIKLDPKYTELWNFHLPLLKKFLQEKYPNHQVSLSERQIRINDFPGKGIDLVVDGRIDFQVLNKARFDSLKSTKREEIDNRLPGIRCYWNYKELNIYPEKDFEVALDEEGLKVKTEKFLYIIDSTYDLLQEEIAS